MTTTSRPLRADARRNREKILAAARDAFAECGLPAQMEDIAGRAGVGVGTLYRHFPTKDALLAELVFAHFSRFAELGRAALERTDDDAWEVLSAHLWKCAEHHHQDRALAQVLAQQDAELTQQAARDSGLVDVTEQLIRRAQAAGAVRGDALMQDVPLLMCGLGAVLQSQWGPNAWKRYFTIALDGLRAGAPSRLPDL